MNSEVFNIDNFDQYFKKNLVIEASAGTGKTYSITKIVTNLVNKGIDVRKILIVTYTEKATGELKDRIRKELQNNDEIKKHPDYLDNLNIFTIHSFCQNMIREFGLEAKQPMALQVINKDTEFSPFFDWYLRENLPFYQNAKKIIDIMSMTDSKYGMGNFKEDFQKAFSYYYLSFNNKPDPKIVSFDSSRCIKLYQLYNECNQFAELCLKDEEIEYNFNILNNGSDKAKAMAQELIDNYDNNYKISFNGNKYQVKRFENKDEKDAFSFFKDLKDRFEKDRSAKNDIYILISNTMNDFAASFQKRIDEGKMQSFDDMLRAVRETIVNGNEQFLNAIKNKYDYAIIDEFQDTNGLQFDIFKNVFMSDDKHNIIVVGDPKQSIYSFQGADLNVYLRAKKEIKEKGGIITYLKTNYRSSEKMIDSCNKLFGGCGEFFKDIDYVDSFSPDGNTKKADYAGKQVEPIWLAVNDENNERIKENDYARLVVSTIVDCCSFDENKKTKLQLTNKGVSRNVSFNDFAILCKARNDARAIINELKRFGVPFTKYKDTGLFNTIESHHWAAIIEAIDAVDFTGKRRNILRRALYTKFFGRTLENINKEFFNHDDNHEVELINKWKELAQKRNWEDLIESILVDSNLLIILKSLNNLQSLTIFKQIGDYCLSYLYDNHTLKDLTKVLKGKISDDNDDETSNIIEIGTDYNSVKIMTIHASKGLQFPIVISCAGFRGFKYDNIGICHDKSTGERKITFDKDKIIKEIQEEWKRLVYVCCTRAEYIMMLPYFDDGSKDIEKSNFIIKKIKNYIDNNYPHKKICYFDKLNNKNIENKLKVILKEDNDDAFTWIEQLRRIGELTNYKNEVKRRTYKHSYSSLSHGDEENNIVFEDDINLEGSEESGLARFDKSKKVVNGKRDTTLSHLPYDGIPRGASIGTALHEIFEKLDFTNPNNNIDALIKERLEINKIPINDNIMEYIKLMVENVLSANLPIIHGASDLNDVFKLSTISNKDKLPEIEFNFNLLNDYFKNYCNGFIDLLFRRGEFYSILDWKSDTLNDDEFISYSDSESLNNHTNDRYSIQRVLYSYCLIKWLKNYYQESEEEIFNNHFGGIYYVYLRGCNKDTSNGIYAQTWNSFKDLENEFNKIMKEKIGG